MVRVGKIVASHGLQGDVILVHVVNKQGWLNKDDVLFLELNKGSFIPFFIASAKAAGDDEYVLKLEEVDQMEAAKKLIGKHAYVKEDILDGVADDSPLLWIGFNLVDKQKGGLGPIEDVVQTGHQWLAKITYEGKEVLVPLIEQLILDVNIKNKFIRMDLPEGLLEL